MDTRTLLEILHLSERLKDVPRHSYTSKGRRESVAEHSWRAALMACLLRDEFPDVDVDRVIRMLLIHDLGEMFTGDIPAFDKTKADKEKEEALLEHWVHSLPAPFREEMAALYAEMAARETKEARLYKAIDNLEAVIQHNEADISTWLPLEYDMNVHYGADKCAFSPYLTQLRKAVQEETLQKIADKK